MNDTNPSAMENQNKPHNKIYSFWISQPGKRKWTLGLIGGFVAWQIVVMIVGPGQIYGSYKYKSDLGTRYVFIRNNGMIRESISMSSGDVNYCGTYTYDPDTQILDADYPDGIVQHIQYKLKPSGGNDHWLLDIGEVECEQIYKYTDDDKFDEEDWRIGGRHL